MVHTNDPMQYHKHWSRNVRPIRVSRAAFFQRPQTVRIKTVNSKMIASRGNVSGLRAYEREYHALYR